MSTLSRPAEILVVEDNPGDARLIREALGGEAARHQLRVAPDTRSALATLRHGKALPYRPDLILLDLHLRGEDGHAILREVKADLRLASIPVIVFTTSSDERDIAASYDLHANAFVTKPIGLDEFIEAVRTIEAFWLGTATLPSGAN